MEKHLAGVKGSFRAVGGARRRGLTCEHAQQVPPPHPLPPHLNLDVPVRARPDLMLVSLIHWRGERGWGTGCEGGELARVIFTLITFSLFLVVKVCVCV